MPSNLVRLTTMYKKAVSELIVVDLNFENPEMRAAIYKMMKFWLDKGCDGFRVS